jgi:hypothetical protein
MEFQEYVDSHLITGGKLLVLGDFNLHLDNLHDVDAKKFRELLFSLDLQQHVNMPTHQRGHILDLVITRSCEPLIQNLQSHPAVVSDHCPLIFQCNINKPAAVKKAVSFRKTKTIDTDAFKADLEKSPLILCPADNIAQLVLQYNDALAAILDKHAPLITQEVFVRPNSPWYTKELANAKQHRRQIERRWMKSRLAVHLETLKSERVHVNKLYKEAKSSFYLTRITEVGADQKAIFKIANELLHKHKDSSLPNHENVEDLANAFSTFFEN